jgi:Cytochrome c oxidase subunit III
MRKQYHRYHLCSSSPWAGHSHHYPHLLYTLSAACLYASLCNIVAGFLLLGILKCNIRLCGFCGGTSFEKQHFRGDHTKKVQLQFTFRLCFILFFLKFMFFFGFFGLFFIQSLSPGYTNTAVFATIWYY